MTRLNDAQLILLSAAAARTSGSLYPLPDTIAGDDQRKGKVIDTLIKRGLAEERGTSDKASICRTGDGVGFGVFLTAAGRAAIDGVEPNGEIQADLPSVAPRVSKAARVLDLLRREEGATLPDLIEATGWLPHTTRATLTRLRKKGHSIERTKRGAGTCYRVAA